MEESDLYNERLARIRTELFYYSYAASPLTMWRSFKETEDVKRPDKETGHISTHRKFSGADLCRSVTLGTTLRSCRWSSIPRHRFQFGPTYRPRKFWDGRTNGLNITRDRRRRASSDEEAVHSENPISCRGAVPINQLW